MKLIVGAGGVTQSGWRSLEQSELDLTDRAACQRFSGVTHILAEHVLEHIAVEQIPAVALNMAAMLAPGGRIRVAVPDGFHPDPVYQAHVAPPADGHTMLWNYTSLSAVFLNARLSVKLLEWWDESRTFKRVDWNPEDGLVRRSFWHDPRNADGQPHYTSLMLDEVKPVASAYTHRA